MKTTKILLVEDNEDLLAMVQHVLLTEEYEVDTALDGETALEMLTSTRYDVAIIDWQLPNLSGVEVCVQYRRRGGKSQVLMLTGKKTSKAKVQGLDAGADDYMTKPFSVDELKARVRALLRRKWHENPGDDIALMVSHDLKTPLMTVDVLLTMLNDEKIQRKSRETDLQIVSSNVKRIIQLVGDFLDTEKIGSEMYQLALEKISIEQVFKACEESCMGIAIQKKVQLNFKSCSTSLNADFVAVTRVLTNLVTNAINHTPSLSTVEVSAIVLEKFVQISVKDDGPGVAPEFREQIFKRFYSAPGEKIIGTSGLGLTISKLLVELWGGEIGVESEGKGSRFYFTVPIGL